MTAITLLKSCAIPPATLPTASRRCAACSACSSALTRSRDACSSRCRCSFSASASSTLGRPPVIGGGAAAEMRSQDGLVMATDLCRIRRQGQDNAKDRAATAGGPEVDGATVVLDDLVREGEPESRTPLLRREEGHEHALGVRARDAGAGVLHFDPQSPRGRATG